MHEIVRRILGIPVRIASDDDAVLALARQAFAAWPAAADADLSIELRVVSGSETGPRPPVSYDLESPTHVRMRTDTSVIEADAKAGRAVGRVTNALVADAQHFRYTMLESAALFLVTQRDRVPFHAAALAEGGRALLIAGPSGTGKSTLAWAALRALASLRLLTEDCVYLQTQPEPRVWGWPGFLHLPADAARYFDELRDARPSLLANGKQKIALPTADGRDGPPWVERVQICILRRSGGPPGFQPLSTREAEALLLDRIEPGFDLFAHALPDALAPHLARGAFRFDPGPDPNRAVPLLRELLLRLDTEPATTR